MDIFLYENCVLAQARVIVRRQAELPPRRVAADNNRYRRSEPASLLLYL